MLFLKSKTLPAKILRSPHSGCNKNNSLATHNKISTIREIDPEGKVSPEATSTTGNPILLKEVPTPPETVNSAFIAKFSTIHNKNVESPFMTTSPVSIKKDSYIGQRSILHLKITITCKIIVIPIMELVHFFFNEHHDSPHECSKSHSTIDFKFVYHFNRNVQ